MSKDTYIIRPFHTADLDMVLFIEKDCYPHPWSLDQFMQELDNPVSSMLVCECGQEVVGYICYWLIVGEMQILNIATSPETRRKGVAAQLLDRAFELSMSTSLSAAWLEVRSSNKAAITLYQRYGFKFSGTRKAYYRDGEDAFVMLREFTD